MKFITTLLITLAFAGCVSEAPIETPQPEIVTKTLVLGEDLVGHMGPIDWSTQDWLLGNAPPTYVYTFGENVRVLSANATLTYDFPNPVLGGGLRTELTAWHGVRTYRDFMTGHSFFDGPDQHAGGPLEATFEMEVPRGGIHVGNIDSYAFSVGHYYVDGVGSNAPAVEGSVDITYIVDNSKFNMGQNKGGEVTLQGGLCLVPADINARVDIPLIAEGTALRIAIGSVNMVLPDVDFFVTHNGERIMHGASPGGQEMVWLTHAGNITEGDELTLTIFNCQPQVATIGYTIHWAQT